MIVLEPTECRVLGTLIEKAQTTPNQYPLTLNSLTLGCNQKNNREPVTELSEDRVLSAIDGLKLKGLAREAIISGSRVNKFKHALRDVLQVGVAEMAVLAELMLRGPQSAGELRARAERMVPPGTTPGVGTAEDVQRLLETMASRAEPLVTCLGRRPGERAERWAQLLCPDLHPLDVGTTHHADHTSEAGGSGASLRDRLDELERSMRELLERVERLEGR